MTWHIQGEELTEQLKNEGKRAIMEQKNNTISCAVEQPCTKEDQN